MSHQCPMCTDFCAPTMKLLLGHINRIHSHSPNVSFTCGLDGCLKSYPPLKKHIQRKHRGNIDIPTVHEDLTTAKMGAASWSDEGNLDRYNNDDDRIKHDKDRLKENSAR